MNQLLAKATAGGGLVLLAACGTIDLGPQCGGAARLKEAGQRLYSEEAVAFHAKDAERFAPCTSLDAVYLITADHQTHTCRQVREHAVERFGKIVDGSFTFRVISVAVKRDHPDQGEIGYEFSFSNLVKGTDTNVHSVHVSGEHRDRWRCVSGSWSLSSMTEVRAQKVTVEGTPQSN